MSSKLVRFSRFYDRLVTLQPALEPFDLKMTKLHPGHLQVHMWRKLFFVRIVSTVRISYYYRLSGAVHGSSTVCTYY